MSSTSIRIGVPLFALTLCIPGVGRDALAQLGPIQEQRVETGRVNEVAFGDIDGDGDSDIVAIDDEGPGLLWIEYEPDQADPFMVRRVDQAFDTPYTSIAIGDLNDDGIEEIVTASGEGDGTIDIFAFQSGTKSFSKRTLFAGGAPRGGVRGDEFFLGNVLIADYDLDGNNDILATQRDLNEVLFFRSLGGDNPLFLLFIETVNGRLSDVEFADMDNDGRKELFYHRPTPRWLDEVPGSTFGLQSRGVIAGLFDGNISLNDSTLGDIDGDGHPDLVAAHEEFFDTDEPFFVYSVRWYRNPLDITVPFEENVIIEFQDAETVAAGDLDSDGDVDIVAASRFDRPLLFLINSGGEEPTFEPHFVSTTGSEWEDLFVADPDNDGDADIVGTTRLGQTLHVLAQSRVRNQTRGSTHASLQAAVDEANPDNVLLVDRVAVEGRPVTDFGDAVLTLASDGPVPQSSNGIWTFGNGGRSQGVLSTMGETLELEGSFTVLPGVMLDIEGSVRGMPGSSVSVGAGARMRLPDDESLSVLGDWTFQSGAVLRANRLDVGVSPSFFGPDVQSFTTSLVSREALPDRATVIADLDGDTVDEVVILPSDSDIPNEALVLRGVDDELRTFGIETLPLEFRRGFLSVGAGDIDGDGDDDLVMQESFNSELSWWDRDDCGSAPVLRRRGRVLNANGPKEVRIGTIRPGGGAAIAFAWHSRFGVAEPVEVGGQIQFESTDDFAPPSTFASIRFEDFSGDGLLDVIFSGLNTGFQAYRNTTKPEGPPTFERTWFVDSFNNASDIVAGDFDGDGDTDFAAHVVSRGALYWLDNVAGDGTDFAFREIASITGPLSLHAIDVDGDARTDIVTSGGGDPPAWYRNMGGRDPIFIRIDRGGFAPGTIPERFLTGDLDADGNEELIGVDPFNGRVELVRTSGDATLTLAPDSTLDMLPLREGEESVVTVNTDLMMRDAAIEAALIFVGSFSPQARMGLSGVIDAITVFGIQGTLQIGDDTRRTTALTGSLFYSLARYRTYLFENGASELRLRPSQTYGLTPAALLAGTLDVVLAEPIDPPIPSSFPLIVAEQPARVSGSFGTVLLPVLQPDAQGFGRRLVISDTPDEEGNEQVSLEVRELRRDISFRDPVVQSVEIDAQGGLLADLNADGLDDVLLYGRDGEGGVIQALLAIDIHSHSEGPVFAPPVALRLVQDPCAVAAADLDDDGDTDLVVSDKRTGRVSVFLNAGVLPLTFELTQEIDTSGIVTDVAVGRLNGDTYPDLALVRTSGERVWIYVGLGDGSVASAGSLDADGGPVAARFIDLDNDGDEDLAVALAGRAQIGRYENTGAELVDNLRIIAGSAAEPTALVRADLNSDGLEDLGVLEQLRGGFLPILIDDDGDIDTVGRFGPIPLERRPGSIVFGDFDGDFDTDALVADDQGLHAYRREGTTSVWHFGGPRTLVEGPGSIALGPVDIDRDGYDDVVVVRASGADRSGSAPLSDVVTLIQSTPPCAGDVDGDGRTATADLLLTVANLGLGSPGVPGTAGDANGDGVTSVEDITFIVGNLGCAN